jgi:hypothetical protein
VTVAPMRALPEPGERGVPRYSSRPFPAYRFVPGVHPHPVRDPAGHSYAAAPSGHRQGPWSAEARRTADDWLYGVDLFNHFYFWEAHEAWEGLWAACEPDVPLKRLLQGLIQIAAALLKTHMGVRAGAWALSQEGIGKLRQMTVVDSRRWGLDLPTVIEEFTAFFAPLREGTLPVIGPDVPALRLRSV